MFRGTTMATVALIIVVSLVPSFSFGFSPKTHYYQIEYLKPSAGDVTVINVIFSAPVSAERTEEFLREEIKRAIEYMTPKESVMAYAWIQQTTERDEQNITLKDGSSFLIYTAKTKKIEREKDYNVSSIPPPRAGKSINVAIEIQLQRNTAGQIKIVGHTNLPEQMQLMIDLVNPSTQYILTQDKTEVKSGGAFETVWMSKQGGPFPTGTYEVTVSSPLPDLQPAAVKEAIGKNGQNLSGKYVSANFGSKMVDFTAKQSLR